ncbi:MAG: hypothetical protein HY260_05340 [Chloroflexi bacterium]|nr:hypothetical protein [Chloroflexota bacterium]
MTGTDALLAPVPELRRRARRVAALLIAPASFGAATGAMFAEPAAFIHKAHRWAKGLAGGLPR